MWHDVFREHVNKWPHTNTQSQLCNLGEGGMCSGFLDFICLTLFAYNNHTKTSSHPLSPHKPQNVISSKFWFYITKVSMNSFVFVTFVVHVQQKLLFITAKVSLGRHWSQTCAEVPTHAALQLTTIWTVAIRVSKKLNGWSNFLSVGQYKMDKNMFIFVQVQRKHKSVSRQHPHTFTFCSPEKHVPVTLS